MASLSSQSQDYNKLLIENAQWRVIYDDDATPWLDEMHGWLIRGGTTISDLQYKKLYERIYEDVSSNIIISQNLYGFLREDTVNKIIYAIESGIYGCDSSNEEYILFDFSYEIGDTSHMCIHTEQLIDCELLNTYYTEIYGEERKIFEFCYSSCAFVEGIGHFQGLLESPLINLSGGLTTLLDDYCIGTDQECNVLYVKIGELKNNQFNIYPNPCQGSVIIHCNELQEDNIGYYVKDVLGRDVAHGMISLNAQSVRIALDNPGYYLLSLWQSGQYITSYKIFNY